MLLARDSHAHGDQHRDFHFCAIGNSDGHRDHCPDSYGDGNRDTGAHAWIIAGRTQSDPVPETRIGETVRRPLTIVNTGRGTLTGNVGSLSAPFTVAGGQFDLARHKRERVIVAFSPTSAIPPAPQFLTITSDDVTSIRTDHRDWRGLGLESASINITREESDSG
ncbi:MAG: hypothetical protein ACYDC3_09385 [Candidatus Binataceae bacterium]